MVEVRTCPHCGAQLEATAPDAPCPACLMKLGMDSWANRTSVDATLDSPASPRSDLRFVPPKPEELSDLFPQFEIIELLGYGGMGAVYKARQKSLDRLVALKIIKPDAAGDSGFAERFAREAKALARLNHSAIVGVHDFGESEGLFFFVMEYVDGTNLRRLIESKELSPAEALQIIPQVCEALQYAHDEGIVHRDIKPENILVEMRPRKGADPDCRNGPPGASHNRGPTPFSVRVKIADFGLAKLLGQTAIDDHTLTGTHQVMGTPRYMAPEQMEGSKAIDHRADIYSLGVVFYEMLTGELPMGSFEPPSRKVQVDVRLDEIVLRSLAKEPERRYQHASEVKTDVELISQTGTPLRDARSDALGPRTGEPHRKPQATRHETVAQHTDPITITRWILILGSLAGIATMFLPWSLIRIYTVPNSVLSLNVTHEAQGYHHVLPILGALLSLTLFTLTLVKTVIGEFPSSARAILAAATGITLTLTGALMFLLAPIPNLAETYSGVLRQLGHGFTDSDWSLRELQILEVQGKVDLQVSTDEPACFLSVVCGVALIVASLLEMRAVIASQCIRLGSRPEELLRGPAAAIRWAAWSSPLMIPVLGILYASDLGYHSGLSRLVLVMLVLQVLHTLLVMPLVLIGVARMQSLLSRRLSMAICIVSMLPMGLSFIFSLPAAIWALLILARPEVERSYREQRVEPHVIELQLRRAGCWLFITAAISFANWAILLGISATMILHDVWQGNDARVRDHWIMLAEGELPTLFWPFLVIGPIFLTLNLVQMLCARQLWRLRSTASGVTAAVLSLVPTSGFWIISFPLGVWSLAVLRQSGVDDIFATRAKPLPKQDGADAPLDVWHLVLGFCIVTPILGLIGFAMWFASTAWVLAALALPWFGACMYTQYYEEKPDKKGEAKAVKLLMLLAFLMTIVLIGLGIFLAKSAFPLFGLVPVVIGGFAGCLVGHFAGKDEEKEEASAEVSASKEASAEDDEDEDEEETPEEKLEWAAWWIALIGAARAWGLLTNVDNAFDKLATGEFAVTHAFLLQLTGPVLVIAAVAAYHARFYWLAVAGAVLCLPTGNCVPVILGFYSLVSLFDPKVRALFLANEATLGAAGIAGADAQVTAKPPMPRGYGDAIGSTLSHAWTEWWRERDALFTRVVQSVIMLLHVVCLLAFLGFTASRNLNAEGQSVYAHNIGVPSPWFTIETTSGGNEFSFHHEIHWTTSAWIVAGLGLGLAYIYCRIEKVRNPDITFWHKPEAFIMIWGILALVDIGIGASLGQLAMNMKRPDKSPVKQVAVTDGTKLESGASDHNPMRQRDGAGKKENEDPSFTQQIAIDPQVAALMKAAEEGDHGRVKELLASGVDPQARDANGETAMMKAAARGDWEVWNSFKTIEGYGLRDNSGRTALFHAIENQQVAFIMTRVEKAQEYLAGWSPSGHSSDFLINAESLSVRDDSGRTPLKLAEEVELEEVATGFRKYLQAVIDANTRRIMSEVERLSSHYSERAHALRALGQIEEADINQREAVRLAGVRSGARVRSAAIHEACRLGDTSRVKELLDEGASVNEKDVAGRTLLMKAIASGNRSLALTLVVLGADLTEQDERGRTAMMYAVEAKDQTFLSRLRQLQQITHEADAEERRAQLRAFSGVERSLLDGRDFDLRYLGYTELECQKDASGETASLIAARAGDWEIYTSVASHVDSLRARDNQGRTIAMHAAVHGHGEWFGFLERSLYFGVAGETNVFVGPMVPFELNQLALTDSNGKTALQLAEENGHTEITDTLRRHLRAIVDNQTAEIGKGGDDVAKHSELRRLAWQALGETEKVKEDDKGTNGKPD